MPNGIDDDCDGEIDEDDCPIDTGEADTDTGEADTDTDTDTGNTDEMGDPPVDEESDTAAGENKSGCGCATASSTANGSWAAFLLLGLPWVGRRRRERTPQRSVN